MQIVTGVEVIIENFLSNVRKMFPRSRRSMATFYEPKANNFQ